LGCGDDYAVSELQGRLTLNKDQGTSVLDGADSRQTSYWVLNYLITAFWVLVLLAQALRTSTQVADETLILGRWSVAFTAVLGIWMLGGLVHIFLFTRTNVGKKIFRADVLLAVISTIVFLVAAELAVRGLDLFPPNALISVTGGSDPILGTRFKSNVIGHDENGWRNETVPEDVDWLFLGDSMTYGAGVSREAAYPYVVGEIADRQTYNLSLGGFGPAEYLRMYREFGSELSPEIVVLGVTLANDLFDLTAENSDRWDALGIDTASVIVDQDDSTNVRATFRAFQNLIVAPPGFKVRIFRGVQQRINQYSAIGRAFVNPVGRERRAPEWFELANIRADQLTGSLAPEWQGVGDDPPFLVYSDELVSTVFTPTRRLIPVKLDFPSIRASVDVTNDIVSTLAAEVEADGGQLVLAFIPTKEEVYFRYLQDRNVELPKSYLDLMSNTEIIKGDLTNFANQLGSCVLDTAPALSEAASRGLQIYFHDNDGHPAVPGHEVIADYLAGELGRLEQGEGCPTG
jgi:hypothetical protein